MLFRSVSQSRYIGVVLYVSDDSKLAPKFIKPKNIGFIVYNTSVKDNSKSVLSITGTLAKNKKVAQIFNDNYGVIDPNYIAKLFTSPDNWKVITNKDELDKFTSKYMGIIEGVRSVITGIPS